MEILVFVTFCIGLIWLCLKNEKVRQATIIFFGIIISISLIIVAASLLHGDGHRDTNVVHDYREYQPKTR
jgi:hypothetical protein